MKLSLLELTQNILSALDSDEVNSISDTAEARQVAQVIRTAYFNILSRSNLIEHHNTFSLDASGDSAFPTLMFKPDNVVRIDWIKYNKVEAAEDRWTDIPIYPFKTFIDLSNMFDSGEANVGSYELDNQTYYYKNDDMPSRCTILKDFYILFDSYDSSVESTLQTGKVQCYGLIVPSFEMSDAFVPEIDELQFMLLLNEAKSLAFLELKQITHEKAELESRRQWRSLQRGKFLHKQNDFDQLPHYGRR